MLPHAASICAARARRRTSPSVTPSSRACCKPRSRVCQLPHGWVCTRQQSCDLLGPYLPSHPLDLPSLLLLPAGSGARIAVICTITPASTQAEETHNTLKFASRWAGLGGCGELCVRFDCKVRAACLVFNL